MKKILVFLHVFVSLGALYGGMVAIRNPYNPLGASVELLEVSPFSNFFIPGVILFVIVGLGNIFAALCLKYQFKFSLLISNLLGWALIVWIIVQCIMMRTVNFLHIIYFVIGLVVVLISIKLILDSIGN
ncbi:hypothetical protein [Halocella sp. SP3-1]|uniref:hypothetical protein n=1 Tax=Halocella sp. SP3-1 TaxID=2382161 RepID=UPI000F74C34A|nr:hypothetical protein [Halocella sp. SP3-1]AZO95140.1 hypothetical protein D7D81_11410 [Halocella sp. SP3-1]MTI60959.1 hypothetical protein [Bacillota bacterium]